MSDADEKKGFTSHCASFSQEFIDRMRRDIDDQKQSFEDLHSLVQGLRADVSRELSTLIARLDDMGTTMLVARETDTVPPPMLVVAKETDAIHNPTLAVKSGKNHENGFCPLAPEHHELKKEMNDKERIVSQAECVKENTLDLDGFVEWYQFTEMKWRDLRNGAISCVDDLRSELLDEIDRRLADKDTVVGNDEFFIVKSESRKDLEHQMSIYNGTSRFSRYQIFHDEESIYTIQQSVWDLGMFIGCPELGNMGSFVAIVLYFVNTFMVLVFCGICHATLTDSADNFNADALDGMRVFRETVHSHEHFSAFDGLSLAYRVCNSDEDTDFKASSLFNSNTQLAILDVIEKYLGESGDWTWIVFGGRMLVVMALSCWFLTVFTEIRDVLGAFRAFIKIAHTEGDTIFEASKAHGNMIIIKAISRRRLMFVLLVLTERLAIAFALFYSGGKWLAHTSSVESLLLNAAALEIVFNVDEMLFTALATDPNKKFLANLHPVTQKKDFHFNGLDLTTASCLLVIPSCVALFYFIYVVPMVDRMILAEEYLCAKDLRWTYGLDNVFGLLWTQSNNDDVSQDWGVVKDDHIRFAGAPERMRSLIQNSIDAKVDEGLPVVELPLPLNGITLGSLDEVVSMPFETMVVTLNPGCVDILQQPWTKGAFAKWVQVVSNNSTISSCEDVKRLGLCEGLDQPYHAMRLVCSETCGCSDPLGSIYSQTALFGCAPRCTTGIVYKTAVKSLLNFAKTELYDVSGNYSACLDKSASWLTPQDFWQVLWNGLDKKSDSSIVKEMAANMSSQGCNFLTEFRKLPKSACDQIEGSQSGDDCITQFADSFCHGDTQYDMRPLSTFCPFTCGCHLTDPQSVCPSQCSQNFYWDY